MKSSKEEFEKNFCSTMLQVEMANRSLLAQTDRKAEFLIQVNGLLSTFLLAFTLSVSPKNWLFLIPAGIQLCSSLTVISICLLVTKPRFFVSNTATRLIDDEAAGGTEALSSPPLFWNLLRDSHRKAVILGIKFRYLHISYVIFVTGLLLCTASIIVVTLMG
jgi:hypothetical protein